jgi:cell division protein FtsQ
VKRARHGSRRGRPPRRGAGRARSRPAPARRLREGRIATAVLGLSLLAGAGMSERVVPVPRLLGIHVQGNARLSDAELLAAAGVAPGAELGAVDAREVARRLAGHAWVRSARAARLPSGSLLLAVEEREPRAVLAGATPFAIDAEGRPFAPVAADAFPELPRIASASPAVRGEPSPALAAAVALAERLAGFGLPPAAEVSVGAADDPRGSAVRLRGLGPRFVLGRDPDAALPRLARVVDSGLPELTLAASVDLRFQDQAVLHEAPSPDGTARAAEPRGRAARSEGRRAG